MENLRLIRKPICLKLRKKIHCLVNLAPTSSRFARLLGKSFPRHCKEQIIVSIACSMVTTYQTEICWVKMSKIRITTDPAFQFSRIHHMECVDQ